MRKTLLILAVVASTLGLSACGATTKATINQSVASLGATSNLQIHLTASASGPGTNQAQSVLSAVSIDVHYSNPTGSSLSQANANANGEVIINVGNVPLLDVRAVAGNLYLNLDVSALSSIPGLNLSASEQAEVQLVVGGRWFEITKSLIASEEPKPDTLKAKTTAEVAIERKIIDALANVIDNGDAKALSGGGYSESGTLESIVQAVEPTLSTLTTIPASAQSVPGTYMLTLNNSGSTATGASITITAPNGTQGNESVSLVASITHNTVTVVMPTGATIITPALIKQLESSGSL